MEQTPAEFARKLVRLPEVVKATQPRAITARALVTKQAILDAARRRMPHHATSRWVQFRVRGEVAEVRLRGGLAHLTELGSHLHPDGWEETPRAAQALNTPDGPRASVKHPALRPRHFWLEGVEAARVPGHRAYEAATHESIIAGLR